MNQIAPYGCSPSGMVCAIIVGLIVAVALVVLAAIGLWVLGVYQQLQATVNA